MNVPETFFSVQEEMLLFLLSCVAGVFIGIFYDVFRTLRIMVKHNFFFVIAEDVLFLACYAVFLSAFASVQARGELRFYFIIGNAIGFTLYFFTLGIFVIRTLKKFFGFLGRIFSPIKALYVILCKKARGKFVGNSKNIAKRIKKSDLLLQNDKGLLYNIRESKKRKNVNIVAEKNERKNGKD
ncbi:MAG: spore cortex biosynthesis protein YabQ [Ruminococcus flavefaciens]|nr:spore cortex biosynthesis protein YabQ [Ruminococcus flavefaciens]MCM1229446.1 spore cortex biosynthesis protein YabQ [Ruminococcus flavefaciens]